jgi:hypothetical protein
MNTQVLSIECKKDSEINLTISIGQDKYKFTFIAETDTVGDQQICMLRADDRFLDLFRFNQHIASSITKLALNFYQGKVVGLPQDLGDFGTREEALESVNQRWDERMLVEPISPISRKSGQT